MNTTDGGEFSIDLPELLSAVIEGADLSGANKGAKKKKKKNQSAPSEQSPKRKREDLEIREVSSQVKRVEEKHHELAYGEESEE